MRTQLTISGEGLFAAGLFFIAYNMILFIAIWRLIQL